MHNIYPKIEDFYSDNDFPRLISYPRTGSHWLRIMMEDYLGMPCGPQAFFHPDATPWGLHVHDRFVGQGAFQEGPVVNLKKVIYLHRNPIDTIFSQMVYDGNLDFANEDVEKLVTEYSLHLDRWLHNNEDIEELLDITYEEIKENTPAALRSVLVFLGYEIDDDRIQAVCKSSSKSKTKTVTPHDPMALNEQSLNDPLTYNVHKEIFREKFGETISKRFEGLR